MKKNMILKLKVFACSAALTLPLLSTKTNFTAGEDFGTKAIIMSDDSNNEVEKETKETTVTTVVTTTTTTTTAVTTTEPVDEYKKIRNLELLKNNDLSIEELNNFIVKYASYTKLNYDEALYAINENIDSVENDYESIRGGIMCILFSYSNNAGILSPYTYDKEVREDMTQEEKEKTMIEFCDNLCMSNDDKSIVLAAFREETGCGTSYRCVQDNNYGGIRIYGEAGCNGQYGMYSTPEFGMYREVKLIYNKLVSIRSNGTNDLNSVVYAFAKRYNPDHADMYSGKILNWVYNVQNDYGNFSEVSYQKVIK